MKICNFVHFFFMEGGYLDSDQFSLLLFGSVGSLEAAHVSKSVRVVFKTVNLLQELAHLKQIEIEPGTLQN